MAHLPRRDVAVGVATGVATIDQAFQHSGNDEKFIGLYIVIGLQDELLNIIISYGCGNFSMQEDCQFLQDSQALQSGFYE